MDRDAWNRRYSVDELVWTAQPNRFLVAETGGLQAGRALDLACGEGRNAIWLAERGWEATGVDFSDVAVTKARQLAELRSVNVQWAVADLTVYDPPPQSFDLVIVFYLQLPRGELDGVLRRACAAVAPGGTFLLVAHDSRNLTGGFGGPKDASVLYTPEDVTPCLDGLEILRAEPVVRTVETPEGEQRAIDVLVRARRAALG